MGLLVDGTIGTCTARNSLTSLFSHLALLDGTCVWISVIETWLKLLKCFGIYRWTTHLRDPVPSSPCLFAWASVKRKVPVPWRLFKPCRVQL